MCCLNVCAIRQGVYITTCVCVCVCVRNYVCMYMFYCVQTALHLQGLCMSFMSQVARDHHSVVTVLCQKHLKLANDALRAPLLQPSGARRTQVEGYWLPMGGETQSVSDRYILTPSVRDNLRNLARIISARLLIHSSLPTLLTAHLTCQRIAFHSSTLPLQPFSCAPTRSHFFRQDQPGQVVGRCHWTPLCANQQPRTHRHTGVYWDVHCRPHGETGLQGR